MFHYHPSPARIAPTFSPKTVRFFKYIQTALLCILLAEITLAMYWYRESVRIQAQSAQYEEVLAHQNDTMKRLADQMSQAGLTLTQEQIETTRREIAFANQLVEKHEFSWTELLRHLERGMSPHVSIQSVRFDFKDSTIALHGTASSMQDLHALTTSLHSEGAFTQVTLTEHTAQSPAEPGARSQMDMTSASASTHAPRTVIGFSLHMIYVRNS